LLPGAQAPKGLKAGGLTGKGLIIQLICQMARKKIRQPGRACGAGMMIKDPPALQILPGHHIFG
jgi:hypothetical protein